MGANLRHYLLSDLQGNLFLYLVLYLGPINQDQVFRLVRN